MSKAEVFDLKDYKEINNSTSHHPSFWTQTWTFCRKFYKGIMVVATLSTLVTFVAFLKPQFNQEKSLYKNITTRDARGLGGAIKIKDLKFTNNGTIKDLDRFLEIRDRPAEEQDRAPGILTDVLDVEKNASPETRVYLNLLSVDYYLSHEKIDKAFASVNAASKILGEEKNTPRTLCHRYHDIYLLRCYKKKMDHLTHEKENSNQEMKDLWQKIRELETRLKADGVLVSWNHRIHHGVLAPTLALAYPYGADTSSVGVGLSLTALDGYGLMDPGGRPLPIWPGHDPFAAYSISDGDGLEPAPACHTDLDAVFDLYGTSPMAGNIPDFDTYSPDVSPDDAAALTWTVGAPSNTAVGPHLSVWTETYDLDLESMVPFPMDELLDIQFEGYNLSLGAFISTAATINTAANMVVIGVDDYNDNLPDLNFAESDAEKVFQTLDRFGFYGNLLRGADADHESILTTLATTVRDAQPDQPLFVYFAGHGFTGKAGQVMLVTGGGGANSVEVISLSDVMTILSGHEAPSLVVLDACMTGAGEVSPGFAANGANVSMGAGVDTEVKAGSVTVVYGTHPGGKALEIGELGGGLFTHYLVKALNATLEATGTLPTAAAPMDQLKILRSILHQVTRDTAAVARACGRIQQPMVVESATSETIQKNRRSSPGGGR